MDFDICKLREAAACRLQNLLQIVLIDLIHCLLEIIVETLETFDNTSNKQLSPKYQTNYFYQLS